MHRSTLLRPLLKLFGAVLAVLLAIAGVSTASSAQAASSWQVLVSRG